MNIIKLLENNVLSSQYPDYYFEIPENEREKRIEQQKSVMMIGMIRTE